MDTEAAFDRVEAPVTFKAYMMYVACKCQPSCDSLTRIAASSGAPSLPLVVFSSATILDTSTVSPVRAYSSNSSKVKDRPLCPHHTTPSSSQSFRLVHSLVRSCEVSSLVPAPVGNQTDT